MRMATVKRLTITLIALFSMKLLTAQTKSKNASDEMHLGTGSLPGDRIPAEFKPYLFHKKGALAAARDDNTAKASSNCQFYLVGGKSVNDQELEGVFTQRVKPANPSFNY